MRMNIYNNSQKIYTNKSIKVKLSYKIKSKIIMNYNSIQKSSTNQLMNFNKNTVSRI